MTTENTVCCVQTSLISHVGTFRMKQGHKGTHADESGDAT